MNPMNPMACTICTICTLRHISPHLAHRCTSDVSDVSCLFQAARYASKLTDLLAFTTCHSEKQRGTARNSEKQRMRHQKRSFFGSCALGRKYSDSDSLQMNKFVLTFLCHSCARFCLEPRPWLNIKAVKVCQAGSNGSNHKKSFVENTTSIQKRARRACEELELSRPLGPLTSTRRTRFSRSC